MSDSTFTSTSKIVVCIASWLRMKMSLYSQYLIYRIHRNEKKPALEKSFAKFKRTIVGELYTHLFFAESHYSDKHSREKFLGIHMQLRFSRHENS